MLPGPDQVVACPKCRALARHFTLLSGNTLGARTWTDGKQEMPMLPQLPPVVKCSRCAAVYWLADAQNLGALPSIAEPNENEYYAAIAAGLAKDPSQEKTLRILAWWRRNDEYRHESRRRDRRPRVLPADARTNLEALTMLLDVEHENEAIMKAEILRELGRFDEARSILTTLLQTGGPKDAVSQIISLCIREDPRVQPL
jgi:hypothetical protein